MLNLSCDGDHLRIQHINLFCKGPDSTIIHVQLSLGSIKFLVFIFSYCPTPLHAKTVFCCDGDLGSFINTKNTHFVKDHPRHIPVKPAFKWFICFRLEYFGYIIPAYGGILNLYCDDGHLGYIIKRN